MLKVVDLINDSPDGVRPTVLVSATAVGYYGLSYLPPHDPKPLYAICNIIHFSSQSIICLLI